MKHPSSFLIKNLSAAEANIEDFRKIVDTKKPDVRSHIFDIMRYINSKHTTVRLSLIYQDNVIVGGASYYFKNINTPTSCCSLYNLFSLEPGIGTIVFNDYWKQAQNALWFKFYVFKKAHIFYSKRNIKYFGASKTGETFSSFGRIYSENVIDSMTKWNSEYTNLQGLERSFLENNLTIFQEKHKYGILKLKEPYKTYLEENMLHYTIQHNNLEKFFL